MEECVVLTVSSHATKELPKFFLRIEVTELVLVLEVFICKQWLVFENFDMHLNTVRTLPYSCFLSDLFVIYTPSDLFQGKELSEGFWQRISDSLTLKGECLQKSF